MRKITWLFTLLLGLSLAYVVPNFAPGRGEQDFLRYWAASRLFWSGSDPYDAHKLEAIELDLRPLKESFGGEYVKAWDPPWLLITLGPLAALPFDWAVPVWVFCNVAMVTAALYGSWKSTGVERYFVMALFLGYLYGNTISLIRLGQISAVVLLSLLIGINLLSKGTDWLAGVCFLLSTIKPHLSFFFLLVILIWVLEHRRWKVIGGMLAGFLISVLVAWILFPGWLGSYITTIYQMPFGEIYTSTLGSFVEGVTGITALRFISIILIPLAFLVAQKIDAIGWFTTLNLTLVLSIPFSFFGYSFDQVLLLPAIVQICAWITKGLLTKRTAYGIGIGIVIIYGVLLWMMTIPSMPYYWFFWIAFSIMCLYLTAWRLLRLPGTPFQEPYVS